MATEGMQPGETGRENASGRMANARRPMTPERRQMRHESRALRTWRAFEAELEDELGWSRERIDEATFAVVAELMRRITPQEANDLMAQLPSVLREHLEHWAHPDEKLDKVGREGFIDRVTAALQCSREEAEQAIDAVFRTIRRNVSAGECEDVAAQLPAGLAEWWRGAPVREGPGPTAIGAMHQLM